MDIDTYLFAEIAQNLKNLQLQLDYQREKIIEALGGEPALYDVTGTGALTATTAKIGAGPAIAGAALQVDGGSVVVGDGAGGTLAKISGIYSSPASTKTISSGAITITSSRTLVTCESGTSDDLDVINGGSDGAFLFLSPSTASTTITLKHNIAGNGSIYTPGGVDVSLTSRAHVALLVYAANMGRWLLLAAKLT